MIKLEGEAEKAIQILTNTLNPNMRDFVKEITELKAWVKTQAHAELVDRNRSK